MRALGCSHPPPANTPAPGAGTQGPHSNPGFHKASLICGQKCKRAEILDSYGQGNNKVGPRHLLHRNEVLRT